MIFIRWAVGTQALRALELFLLWAGGASDFLALALRLAEGTRKAADLGQSINLYSCLVPRSQMGLSASWRCFSHA